MTSIDCPTLRMYSLTGLLWTSSGGAQDSFTVLEEKDITRLVDMKVIDIEKSVAEAVAEEIAEEIEEELEEEIVEEVKEEAEELVEEEVLEEMVKEAVIDLAEAEAVEDNIVESEVTTVEPSEEEVDFGDITEVAV